MSILSRCLWQTTISQEIGESLLDDALIKISPWAFDNKNLEEILDTGEWSFQRLMSGKSATRRIVCNRIDEYNGVIVNVEDTDYNNDLWGVSIRIHIEESTCYFWIDNTLESNNPNRFLKLGRPRAVSDLLQLGNSPSFGNGEILTCPETITTKNFQPFLERLQSNERLLPLIAITCPYSGFDQGASTFAEKLATRVTGFATVATITPEAQEFLRESLPDGLGVWGGSIRVYGTGPLDASYKHRLYSLPELSERLADSIVYRTAMFSTRRYPPEPLRIFDRKITSMRQGGENAEVVRLQEEIDNLKLELEILQDEYNESEADLNSTRGKLERTRRQLRQYSAIEETESPADNDPPDEVSGWDEAIEYCQRYLSDRISLPLEAIKEREILESTPTAIAWGNALWRGLSSLHAYCEDQVNGKCNGGFYQWCISSGRWNYSNKKLAMRESTTVRNNDTLRSARMFPCSSSLDPSGRILMEAHLKISEGGGSLAPRVYFFDDSRGPTKKIHVGMIGPHYLTPNTRT
ncbi:hypothetical protein M0E84_09570 [Corynebacterium sp. CCM 9186]|uniref:hypothetical protein n=1 Tax=Corynebacterium meridianum TaxID=2765363 RepID=UPI002003D570|nr:hypothetical protein [Corynebacterium meridianum]MCK7678276.1 hypothetical protein [Corynebacterium meridianum]